MKKQIAFALCLAAAQILPLSVCAEEATEAVEYSETEEIAVPVGMDADFGFSFNTSAMSMNADYVVNADAEGTAKESMTLTIDDGTSEEPIEVSLDDFLIIDSENIYINISSLTDLVSQIAEIEDVDAMLSMVGITEDWLKLPIPDFSYLTTASEDDSAVDPTELGIEAAMLFVPYMPTEEDGVYTISLTKDDIISIAEGLDDITSSLIPSETTVDLKPALADYIQAIAEGYAESVEGSTAEEVEDMLNSLLDFTTESFISSVSAGQLTGSLSIADAVKEALADQDLSLTLTYDAESFLLDVVADDSRTCIQGQTTEDGLYVISVGDGEAAYLTGELTAADSGFILSLKDVEDTEIFSAALNMTDNEYDLVVSVEGEELLSGFVKAEEESFSAGLEMADLSILLDGGLAVSDTGIAGQINLDLTADGENMTIGAYMDMEAAEDAAVIEIPEAVDGLEILKDAASLYFAFMDADEVETEF